MTTKKKTTPKNPNPKLWSYYYIAQQSPPKRQNPTCKALLSSMLPYPWISMETVFQAQNSVQKLSRVQLAQSLELHGTWLTENRQK